MWWNKRNITLYNLIILCPFWMFQVIFWEFTGMCKIHVSRLTLDKMLLCFLGYIYIYNILYWILFFSKHLTIKVSALILSLGGNKFYCASYLFFQHLWELSNISFQLCHWLTKKQMMNNITNLMLWWWGEINILSRNRAALCSFFSCPSFCWS